MINNNSNSVHQRILSRFIVRIRDVSCSISDKSRVRKGQIGRERERENRGIKITRNSVKKDLWFSLYNMSFGEKFIRINEWLDEWTIVCVRVFVCVCFCCTQRDILTDMNPCMSWTFLSISLCCLCMRVRDYARCGFSFSLDNFARYLTLSHILLLPLNACVCVCARAFVCVSLSLSICHLHEETERERERAMRVCCVCLPCRLY